MGLRRTTDVILLALLAGVGLSLAGANGGRRGQPAGSAALPRGDSLPRRAERPGLAAAAVLDAPRGGWLQTCTRVLAQVGEDRVLAEAAGVTFYTLLAAFPAMAALISLYGLVADPATIASHLSIAGGLVPAGGMQIISEQVHSLAAAGHQALGFGAVTGIVFSLWSASAGIRAIFDALNAVYEEREQRGFVRRVLLSLAFTLGGILFVVLAVAGVVALPIVLDYAGLKSSTDTLLSLLRWPVLLAAVSFMLGMIYRFGPSQARGKWRWVSWGSGFAAIVWVLASAGFSYYAANFGSYNKTYGSLGAAVGFMTWIWISTIIMLVGAELNAEMERRAEPVQAAGTSV
jgi:membrane protein